MNKYFDNSAGIQFGILNRSRQDKTTFVHCNCNKQDHLLIKSHIPNWVNKYIPLYQMVMNMIKIQFR